MLPQRFLWSPVPCCLIFYLTNQTTKNEDQDSLCIFVLFNPHLTVINNFYLCLIKYVNPCEYE